MLSNLNLFLKKKKKLGGYEMSNTIYLSSPEYEKSR